MAKRALLLVVVFLTLFSLGTRLVLADNHEEEQPDPNQQFEYVGDKALMEMYSDATKRCDTPSLECLVYYTVNYTAIEITNSIMKVPPESIIDDSSPSAGGLDELNLSERGGLVPGMTHLISAMYSNPAATTHTYIAYMLDSAGVAISPPAYAQGLGFVALNPILELWKTFRNIAYVFYVLMFVVIGFLIMFRQKVGQQAITAQQAIPSIIISLIFVTFSYAIAGFAIDLMYLTMFLIVGIFDSVGQLGTEAVSFNIFQLAGTFISDGYLEGYNVASDLINSALNLSTDRQSIPGWIGGVTIGLVIAVAVLIGTFKLFFELLKSYATVVLLVVTGPVQLMIGAIPGRNTFTPWIKNIIGNLSAFPVVLIGLIMFKIFVDGSLGTEAGGFMPPFLVGRGQAGTIAGIMGLALLLAIPEIVKKIKEMFGASGGFGDMIAGAAWGRFQEGWTGNKYTMGLGARHVVRPGLTVGATGATTAIGAAGGGLIGGVGGALRSIRGGDPIGRIRTGASSGARRGASAGFQAPTRAQIYPGLIKNAIETARSETSQYMQYEALEKLYTRMKNSPHSPQNMRTHAETMLTQLEKRKNRGTP